MKLTEVLKKSFLEGYGSVNIDFATIVMCMIITVLVAMYIFMIYRMMNRKAFYNRNFNLALIALAVITAAIILTIQSNIVISLGMVGGPVTIGIGREGIDLRACCGVDLELD